MTRDGDPFFASDGRLTASVDPVYPGDDDDRQAIAAARDAGRREAAALILDSITGCPHPDRRIAALCYIANKKAKTVGEIAKALSISRMTMHREIRIARKLPVMPKPAFPSPNLLHRRSY